MKKCLLIPLLTLSLACGTLAPVTFVTPTPSPTATIHPEALSVTITAERVNIRDAGTGASIGLYVEQSWVIPVTSCDHDWCYFGRDNMVWRGCTDAALSGQKCR